MEAVLLFVCVVIVLALTIYVFMLRSQLKQKQEELSKQLERNHELNTMMHAGELKSLRYKLNPHLFKNALNSIQSHAYQTYYSMDKLSGVLDYILYDSDQPLVSLAEEMDFAANFIEINRMKLSPLFDLRVRNSIENNGDELKQMKILPLLTVDLIENAFKHTDFQKQESFISIHFQLKGNSFQLEVSNRISQRTPLKKEKSGLGIQNLKERLEIAYPDAHQLKLVNQGDVYHAILTLELNG